MFGCCNLSVENGGDVKCVVMLFLWWISVCIVCGCGRFMVIELSCVKCLGLSCWFVIICSMIVDSDVWMFGIVIWLDGVKLCSDMRFGWFVFSDSDVVDSLLMLIILMFGMLCVCVYSLMKFGVLVFVKLSVLVIIVLLMELLLLSSIYLIVMLCMLWCVVCCLNSCCFFIMSSGRYSML